MEPGVRRNLVVLLSVCVIFGLAVGVYDVLLPYYLDFLGMSMQTMGLIFSVAALVIALTSIYIASLSDIWGRKSFYSAGVLIGALAASLTPLAKASPLLVVAKTLREAATRFRDSLQGVLIYEFASKRFMDFFSKTRGLEYLSEGSGQMVAGTMLILAGFSGSFYICAAMLLVAAGLFVAGFREQRRRDTAEASRLPLGEVFSLRLPRPLALITVSSFVFSFGLSTSHCFIMPLFFAKKFGASVVQVSMILGLHRLSLALPLIFTGALIRSSFKRLYFLSMLYEGFALALSGAAPTLLTSAAVWLTHDVGGAGLWIPIQAGFIQRYARPELRARDASRVRALGSLGWIFGPILAGLLAPVSISLPFVASGLIVASSALPIVMLRDAPDLR